MKAILDRSKRRRRRPAPNRRTAKPASDGGKRQPTKGQPAKRETPPFLRQGNTTPAGARFVRSDQLPLPEPRREPRRAARSTDRSRQPLAVPDVTSDDVAGARDRQGETDGRKESQQPASATAAAQAPAQAPTVQPTVPRPTVPPSARPQQKEHKKKAPDDDAAKKARAKGDKKKEKEKDKEKKDDKDEKKKENDADKKTDKKGRTGKRAKGGRKQARDNKGQPGGAGERAGRGQAASEPVVPKPEPLPPRPRPPRLGGIFARTIPPPPQLSDERVREIVERTGMRPEAHHASIRRRLNAYASRAVRLQARIARQARLDSMTALATFAAKADEVPVFTATSEERVRGAYGGARARVRGAAKKALARIRGHKKDAGDKLDSSTLTMEQQIQRVLKSSSPAVRALHKEQLGVVTKDLDTFGAKFRTELGEKEKTLRDSKPKAVSTGSESFAAGNKALSGLSLGSGSILAARREAEKESWARRAAQKADDVKRSIEQNKAMIAGQKEPFSISILRLLNPAAVQVETVATHEKGQVKKARKQTRLRVATDYERAVNAVTQFRDTAIRRLDQGERAAVKEIRAIGTRVEMDVRSRGENLDLSIAETALDLVDAYRKQMAGLNRSLDVEGLLEVNRYEPLLLGAERRLERMHAGQSAELEATVAAAIEEAAASVEEQMGQARELADKSAGEAYKIARDQVAAINESTDAFVKAVTAPASSVTAEASPFSAKSSETLGKRPAEVRAKVQEMLTKAKETLGGIFTAEGKRLQAEIDNLPKSLRALIADGLKKISELNQKCRDARNAMVGAGTREGPLMDALRNITAIQGRAMEVIWSERKLGKSSLRQWLKDDLSGDELRAARAYLSGDTAAGARYELEASMSWYGDDEERIENVMRDLQKEPPPGGHIKQLQNTKGWEATKKRLDSNLDGTDLKVTDALLAGNKHRADALRLKDKIEAARRVGDHDKVNKLLEGIPDSEFRAVRREFAAIDRGLGVGEKDKAKVAAISDQDASKALVRFVTKDRKVYDPHSAQHGGPAFRTMTISGGQKKLAEALARRSGNPKDIDSRVAIQAARMEVETTRKGKPDHEKLSKAFERDQAAALDPDLQSPDPNKKKAAEDRLKDADRVRELALVKFTQETSKHKDATPEQAKDHAAKVVGNLFDTKVGQEYGNSMVKDGFAKPELAMRLAVQGSGTDEDLIKRTLGRLDKDEIKKLKKDYKKLFKEDLDDRLGTSGKGFGELSGDDRLEVELLLEGRPRNDKERYLLEKKRTEQQRFETGGTGEALMSGSSEEHLMNDSNRRMIEIVRQAGGVKKAFDENGRFIGSKPEKDEHGVLQPNVEEGWAFGEELKWNKFGAESYQAGIDRITNIVTTAIAVIAAVAVTILVPGVGGAIAGAIIGGLLSMGAKAAIKGGRYGWEEAGVDLAVTAVDAATAGLTHGMGQAMRAGAVAAKGAKAARPAGKLAGLAAKGRAGKAAAYVASEGMENFVGALPSAFVGQTLNDNNWKKGNPFGNILKGTMMEAGISTGVGLGMGAGMDVASGAIGAMRGAMRSRAMRKELLKSVPPDMRAAFGDVPILELSPAQFKQMTGSESGQAVTVFTPDGPAIYVKEGADPRALREEGVHLAQSREAEWAGKAADLSEANLARWPEMSIGEQLSLYRNKLDLEIDAQKRLLDDLGDELALAGPLSRRSLRRQMRQIQTALDNLQGRRFEVERIGPERMQSMSRGNEPRPDYLDQPPRLFHKKGGQKPPKKADEPEPEPAGPSPIKPETKKAPLPTTQGDPDYSPLSGHKDVEGTVVEIGTRWEENGREYRLVGVDDGAGNITNVRQEIRSAHEDNRWVQRGSESRKKGEIAELASRRQSSVDTRDGGWESHPVESQWDPSGRGFDEVLLDFRMEGDFLVARARVVEVKDYPRRYIPLQSFTAVRPSPYGNLDANLKFIIGRLEKVGTLPRPKGYGLSQEQLEAALMALKLRNIDLEIRITPNTLIGARDRGNVLKDLEGEWKGFGMQSEGGKARVETIQPGYMGPAKADVEAGKAPTGIAPEPPKVTATTAAKPKASQPTTAASTPKTPDPSTMSVSEKIAYVRAQGKPELTAHPQTAAAAPKTPDPSTMTTSEKIGYVRAHGKPEPTGSTGPLGQLPPSRMEGGDRLIVEPYLGPSVESPLHLAQTRPGAKVVGTEAFNPPELLDIRRLEAAGGVFMADNLPPGIGEGTVDQFIMRFPLPHDKALEDVSYRLAQMRQRFRDKSPFELMDQLPPVETLVNYGPYALARLKSGGEMEIVFDERQILSDLERVGRLEYVDANGQGYRLELEGLVQRPKGEIAPHSGFGLDHLTPDSLVYQARLRKVPIGSSRGADFHIGRSSGRPYQPDLAGGPVRQLDIEKVKITERAVDVVDRHIRRFGGGGELELAMVDRLRRIVRGEIEPTRQDLLFYTHELREFVRFRRLGWGKGLPTDKNAAWQLWNRAHTATLEDYGLREGAGVLHHPDVETRALATRGPSGAAAPRPVPSRTGDPMPASLEPPIRRAMEVELARAGHPRAETAKLTDAQLVDLHSRAQLDQLDDRLRGFRDDLDPRARAEFDALSAAGHQRHDPVDAAMADRLSTALATKVRTDPGLPPGEIRVQYEMGPLGDVRGLEIRAGAGATLEDVLLHVPTLAALRRYQGLTGLLSRAIDSVRRYLRGGGRLPVGSKAHESWLELEKLPAIIEARQARLLAGGLDSTTRVRLEREIENLQAQLTKHLDTLDDFQPGLGYVAGSPSGREVPAEKEIDAEARDLLDRGLLKPSEVKTFKHLRRTVGRDVSERHDLEVIESPNQADFAYTEPDRFLMIVEVKGDKRWMDTSGNAPSKQLGGTLDAKSNTTIDSLPLSVHLLTARWDPQRFRLLLAATNVKSKTDPFLAVEIDEGTGVIRGFFPVDEKRLKEFLADHDMDLDLLKQRGLASVEDEYTALRRQHGHDAAGQKRPISDSSVIVLIPVQTTTPQAGDIRERGGLAE